MNPPVPQEDSWSSEVNAAAYDQFCTAHGMYRTLSIALLEQLPSLTAFDLVCDLGCGTGESTRALQVRVSENATIVGVDSSPSMLKLAKSKASAGQVTYELIESAPHLRFDLIFANASIWQFKSEELARFLRKSWGNNGTILYNLPSELARDPRWRHLVDAATFSSCLFASKCSLEIVQWTYTGTQAEALDFLGIPVFRRNAEIRDFLAFPEFSAEWTFVKVQQL